MSSKLIQGQSGDATELKQRGLSLAYRPVFASIKKVGFSATCFNFDLNAGSGYNDEAGCIGSPLTFISESILAGHEKFVSILCDNDIRQINLLKSRTEIDSRCRIEHCDNSELIYKIPNIIETHKDKPQMAMGCVLSDPNGADVPIWELAWLAGVCPRLDIIFHWNSTITKRLKYGIRPSQITIMDVSHIVGKLHWLIRKPVGIHQHALLIGRNIKTNDWKSMGFYHLDTPEGKYIADICSTSEKDRAARSQICIPLDGGENGLIA